MARCVTGLSGSNVDDPQSGGARDFANGCVEPRVDQDTIDPACNEVTGKVGYRNLVAQWHRNRAVHDTKKCCDHLRAASMDKREAARNEPWLAAGARCDCDTARSRQLVALVLAAMRGVRHGDRQSRIRSPMMPTATFS